MHFTMLLMPSAAVHLASSDQILCSLCRQVFCPEWSEEGTMAVIAAQMRLKFSR